MLHGFYTIPLYQGLHFDRVVRLRPTKTQQAAAHIRFGVVTRSNFIENSHVRKSLQLTVMLNSFQRRSTMHQNQLNLDSSPPALVIIIWAAVRCPGA